VRKKVLWLSGNKGKEERSIKIVGTWRLACVKRVWVTRKTDRMIAGREGGASILSTGTVFTARHFGVTALGMSADAGRK